MNRLRQAGYVKRYHTIPTIGNQSVAEHSFHVCMILLDLLQGEVSNELLKAALYHDLPEIETGDIPATTKWRCKEIGEQLNVLESLFENSHGLKTVLTHSERQALKFADMYELVLYCIDQLELGNRNMKVVAKRGLNYLTEMQFINERALKMIRDARYKLMEYDHESE